MRRGTIAPAWCSPEKSAASGESAVKSSTTATLAFAASTLALVAAPAFAQIYEAKQPIYDQQPVYDNSEDIIVTAPGVQHYDTGRRTSSGAPIQIVSEQRVVETGDLDLRYNADVRELRRRIADTAVDACNSVERHVDVPLDSNRDCVRDATRDAMAQADDLIATERG
jgi:UrcA family protein